MELALKGVGESLRLAPSVEEMQPDPVTSSCSHRLSSGSWISKARRSRMRVGSLYWPFPPSGVALGCLVSTGHLLHQLTAPTGTSQGGLQSGDRPIFLVLGVENLHTGHES